MVLVAIVVNCVFMALNPPFEELERDSELVFICIFTIEMSLKMVRNQPPHGGRGLAVVAQATPPAQRAANG